VGGKGRGTPVPRRTAWKFSATGDAGLPRDDALRFRNRAETAVRAGHGLGARIHLTVRAGRAPGVLLESHDSTTEGWVGRLLASSYEPGEWRRILPSSEVPEGPVLVARRLALPGEGGAVPTLDASPVLRTLVVGFSSLPAGASLTCRLEPLARAARSASLPLLIPDARAEYGRAAAARPPPRSHDGARARGPTAQGPEPGLLWRADVELRAPPGADPGLSPRLAAVAESAWRRLDGVGVRFGTPLLPRWLRPTFLLTDAEVASLLPYRDLPLHDVAVEASGSPGLPIGRGPLGAVVGLPARPGEGRHLAVLGETGMGKSSLLVQIALRVPPNATVIVLDPLGETARAIRDELPSIPGRLLFLGAGEEPPGANALEGIGAVDAVDPVRAERRVDDIVHALRRVRAGRYAASPFWGPRIEEMLTRAVRVAAGIPGGTLEDAHTVLATAGHTRRVVPPGVRELLGELADRIRERPEDADGARRLLYEVVRNPTLRRSLCDPDPKLALRDLVAPGRVVLVSGDAARVGESTARYLLAVDLALIWSELLARDDPGKVYIVLDEVQWYAHDSLAEMLQLGRRKNVHVILATQALASLPEGVREAAWTNVADFVAFRGSPEEARELATIARGAAPWSLSALPRGTALALLGKGQSATWIRTARVPSRPRPTLSGNAGQALPEVPPTTNGPAPPPSDPSASGIVREIEERARATAPGQLLRLPLADLAGSPDPGGAAVRSAGSALGRLGALVRTERAPEGRVWWIDPGRLPNRSIPRREETDPGEDSAGRA
jgi:Helicase HerA, central domain